MDTINEILNSDLSDKDKLLSIEELTRIAQRLGDFNPHTQYITKIWSIEDVEGQLASSGYEGVPYMVASDILDRCIDGLEDCSADFEYIDYMISGEFSDELKEYSTGEIEDAQGLSITDEA